MLSDTLYALPLPEQVGQFFYIGLPGTELDAQTRELIEEVRPGGVIIFGRNVASPQQLRDLLDGVRQLVPIEPLVGIDQEGGLVDRLRKIFTPMPAARSIREHGDLAASRTLGRVSGEVLRMLGFNMNFAPVMSIMTDERDLLSNGLYSRSFGRSPGEVLGYTTVYLRGLQETGLIGCLKHFPGIGAGEVDSLGSLAHRRGGPRPAALSLKRRALDDGKPFFAISSATGDGVRELVNAIAAKLDELSAERNRTDTVELAL